MEKKLYHTVYIVVIAILVLFNIWLLINGRILASRPEISKALDKIVALDPNKVIEHDEHFVLLLSNGDMIEFTKDNSLSYADVVMVINVKGISEGVVDLDSVKPCPPPDQKLEDAKFCYVSAEILAHDEPHLAEAYPEGIILRPFDIK